MKAAQLEIEIDGPHNECLHYRPLQRNVRGRFDLTRIGEPMARMKTAEWPLPIPSQRLGIDREGIGYIIEPLHDDAHAPTREKIERTGAKLEPALVTFEDAHLPTWQFWIKRAVESGIARVTAGKLPDAIEGKPRTNFILADPGPSSGDKLTAALDKQTAAFDRLATALEKLLAK